MTIVRLQGCPVGCVFCDTPESWLDPTRYMSAGARPTKADGTPEWLWLEAQHVAEKVAALPPRWALVTGGEPLWHHCVSLTASLHKLGIKTALETSGTYIPTGEWDYFTLSPKPKGLRRVNRQAIAEADEIKFVIGREQDLWDMESWLEVFAPERNPSQRISIQPMSATAKATALCLDALMKRPEWRLSLQIHKILEIA